MNHKPFNQALIAFAVFSFVPLSIASAAVVEYSSGHGDIGLAYEAGELELHYHFADGAVLDGVPLPPMSDIEYDPNEAYVRVGDNTRAVTLEDALFLGTVSGDSVWLLPQSNTSGMPFLGIAAEELDSQFSGAMMSMTSFSGPGEFALWQSGGIGGTNVFWQSNDGLDDTDKLNLTIGGHDHYNFGFTAEGVYDVGISAVADFAGGGPPATDFGTFRFVVGNATAIPEPTSFTALAMLGTAFTMRRYRRK